MAHTIDAASYKEITESMQCAYSKNRYAYKRDCSVIRMPVISSRLLRKGITLLRKNTKAIRAVKHSFYKCLSAKSKNFSQS